MGKIQQISSNLCLRGDQWINDDDKALNHCMEDIILKLSNVETMTDVTTEKWSHLTEMWRYLTKFIKFITKIGKFRELQQVIEEKLIETILLELDEDNTDSNDEQEDMSEMFTLELQTLRIC